MARVVIDPGHGGSKTIPNDSTWNNAVGPNGTLEKNLTLDIGKRAAVALTKAGHSVQLTRSTDVNLKLADRARVARAFKAHAFVSIHLNGSDKHNAQGTETLVHTNHSVHSAKLSLAVQDAVLTATGLADRNKKFDPQTRIKPQKLGVLNPASHDAATAACLLEVSFLDRADEEKRLQDPKYLDAIAQAIADGVTAYAGAVVPATVAAMEAEVGDAIELAALDATLLPDTVGFLGLDGVAIDAAHAPAPGTADLDEAPGRPAGLFSVQFVNNTGSALELVAAEVKPSDFTDLVGFIQSLKLRYFTPDELLFLGASNRSGSCKGTNYFPGKDKWNNIVNTVRMLDLIRDDLGSPIRILSCYRSPEYNTCIGGEPGSLHMEFNAIDFTCASGTPEIWRRVANRIRLSDPAFTGGIGVYPGRGFVHIDTRGQLADWKGS
ncbi:MAG: N-acetylmuramoyl-L-alanine amidase [Methylobacterium sp.]|uniref:N-acetylmuramoyl-L-alanine amidase n=1 Tax=Methylobacterium sp. TaxID=409 RepID=UPI00258BFFDE|nr:N-acetylmuramoyl-L-alanine amidase [Methylobacterium sp.]MBY0298122.1 N-acetylmuramoyl-L-alanine amidase [Methylobacterium sp.]